MALQIEYTSLDDVPAQYHDLYSEKDGKYQLTGVTGYKTQKDIDSINSLLIRERQRAKELETKYSVLANYDVNDIVSKLDRYDELELAAKGSSENKEEMEKLLETRLNSRIAPITREKDQLQKQLEQTTQELARLQQERTQRAIHDSVIAAATAAKVVPTALEDVKMMAERMFEVTEDGRVVTKDSVGVTPGVEADVFITEIQDKRPHWWPQSQGAGSKGSGSGSGGYANNPFSRKYWNYTEQGQLIRENPAKAEQMAKAAGTTVGGPMPKE
jgi:flagellar biosynthesis/type III secretory pathway chaperone